MITANALICGKKIQLIVIKIMSLGYKDLAAQTVGSCHKQWRISLSPALCIALPNRHFREMGLPDIRWATI
ncbi:hypothetical protein [Symbiopectobacterium sp. RP]|uniref:hypothetical protein n=1 Tax=Symbiopectobacterium sp. RP TaxID=3248553 RepID=UPI003D28280C